MMKFLRSLLAALLLPTAALALPASSIPTKFPLVWGQNAGSSYIRSIPSSSQIGIQNCAASLNDGFPPLTFTPIAAGGCPPFGQDMNGILNQTTAWSQWQEVGGPVPYDGTFSSAVAGYPVGAAISAANHGNFWYSNCDNNTYDPDTTPTSCWTGFSPISLYALDSGTANAGSATLPVTISALSTVQGRLITIVKTSSVNTAGYSLTLNSFTAQVRHPDGTALVAGDLPSGATFTVVYTGTYFILQSAPGSAATKAASDPTQTTVASVAGATTSGGVATFNDTAGTVHSSGAAFAAVGWVRFHWTGSSTVIDAGQNVASVTRNSTGNYTVALSSGSFNVVSGSGLAGSLQALVVNTTSAAGGSAVIEMQEPTGGGLIPTDPTNNGMLIFY